MTREEAIAIIHKEYLCVDRDCDIERSCGKCDLMMPNKEPILQAYKLAIKALKHTRWIPVSERLPENKTYVLTTIHIPGRPSHARSGWYQDGFFHNDNGDVWNATDIEVQAWMPLPEPYKAERSGEV